MEEETNTWQNKIRGLDQIKQKQLLSIMVAVVFLGVIGNVIWMMIPNKSKTSFSIPVTHEGLSDPYPVLPNEANIGSTFYAISELKEIENDIQRLYKKESLTKEDSLRLIYHYERLQKLNK